MMEEEKKLWVRLIMWMVEYAGSNHRMEEPYNHYYTGPEWFKDRRFPTVSDEPWPNN